MSWALWLAVPAGVTALSAVWGWWRGRPEHEPCTDDAVRSHSDYLAALVIPARGTRRVEPVDLSD